MFWEYYKLWFDILLIYIVKNVLDVKFEVDFEMDIIECGNIVENGEILVG